MPIISDTGGMSGYQRFRFLEGKGYRKRTRGVRHAVLEGCNAAHPSGTTRIKKRQFDIKSRLVRHYKKNIFVISNSRFFNLSKCKELQGC